MAVDSFREYLTVLAADGRVNHIDTDVSWNLEASAITMLANQSDDAIPVFESVVDSSIEGARLVGDPYRGSATRPWDGVARALGFPATLSAREHYNRVTDRLRNTVEPTTVSKSNAPCKEIIRSGEEVDLLDFPWPYIHEGDGGRYSNLHTVIVPDPNLPGTNWAPHRAMIHDDRRASVLLIAGEQIPNLFYYYYERHEEPMPIAIAVGAEPAVQFSTAMWIPANRGEAEFAGGLKERPVELVDCETTDLQVPATAELVLEGRIVPDERLDEGPFGDYFGYMNGPRRSMPVLEVDAVTSRREPLIPFCVSGSGVGYGRNSASSLEIACAGPDSTVGLQIAGFDVEMSAPWKFSPTPVYTIATRTPYDGYLHELANFIFTTWGMLHIDVFVFVDDDVNPLNQRAVIEAIALHADPKEDFHQFGVETMPKVPLNIYQTPEEKGNVKSGTSKTKTAKAYIDATRDGDPHQQLSDERMREQAQETLVAAGVDESVFADGATWGDEA